MPQRRRWMVTALVAGALTLAGCAKTSSDAELVGPATLSPVAGTELQQITLTDKAVERLDLQMAAIAQEGPDLVIPYAAVVYDADGKTWAYTSPKKLTYVRSPITVTRIAGDKAFLSAGPAVGTNVVTVATAELYGTEAGIGY
jgi:hypothetical protein